MKQLTKCLLIITISLYGCTHRQIGQEASAELSVLIDITDAFQLRPDSCLFSQFDFMDMPEMAARYRIGLIADRNFTSKRENGIEDGVKSEAENKRDDPNYRQKRIRSFYGKFCSDLKEVVNSQTPQAELHYSLCYQQIAGELARLSSSSARNKSLVVFSDLLEKSEVFDCYSDRAYALLESNPDSVIAMYSHACPLPANLAGIQVRVYHCPRNRQEDAIFKRMVLVYSRLIERSGGKMTVETTYPTLLTE